MHSSEPLIVHPSYSSNVIKGVSYDWFKMHDFSEQEG